MTSATAIEQRKPPAWMRQSIRRTGKCWQRPTTPTTSTARPASPPDAAVDTDNAAALAWRCGRRIAIDLNPIIESPS